MKELTTRGTWIIGKGCLYAGINEARDTSMGIKEMKDLLLLHRVHQYPKESLCVAHLFCTWEGPKDEDIFASIEYDEDTELGMLHQIFSAGR